jgi:hypothetical protein
MTGSWFPSRRSYPVQICGATKEKFPGREGGTRATTSPGFPPPWQVEQPGGYKVLDASGQALVHIYARGTREQASIDKALLR